MYFLNPIWLTAAAGIIVPVLIHLWNIRQGKVLRIGSTMLLAGAIQKSSSSLKISQWLLLCLRCLLILFLAFLLAGPQWKTKATAAGKGWILIKRNEISDVITAQKNSIDSLLKAGFELHDFNAGFPIISLSDSVRSLPDGADNDTVAVSRISPTEDQSPWHLIRLLDIKLPAGYPVFVFSKPVLIRDMQVNTGQGGSERPVISIDLQWKFLPPDENKVAEPVYLKQQPDGQLRTLTMHSTEMASWFTTQLSGTVPGILQADTSTLRITIFHDANSESAKYMEAAINAVAGFNHQKLRLVTTQTADAIAGGQHWIFWLSEKTVPESVQTLTQNLLHYASGNDPIINTTARFTNDDGPIETDPIRIYKSYAVVPATGDSIVWQDDKGHAILSKQAYPSRTWQLFTRLDSDWSDLTWSPAFPKMIAALIMNRQFASVNTPADAAPISRNALSTINSFDKRIVPLEDANPTFAVETYKEKQSSASSIDLEHLCWIIVFLLFASERIVSYHQKQALRA